MNHQALEVQLMSMETVNRWVWHNFITSVMVWYVFSISYIYVVCLRCKIDINHNLFCRLLLCLIESMDSILWRVWQPVLCILLVASVSLSWTNLMHQACQSLTDFYCLLLDLFVLLLLLFAAEFSWQWNYRKWCTIYQGTFGDYCMFTIAFLYFFRGYLSSY